ncbi:MAG TPA: NUDIX hydrolase [Clostridia bacterium]
METIAFFNRENVSEDELKAFRHRRAVRCVVFDNEENVALLYVPTGEYYGLPGGGVDQEETFDEGVVRECKEELGCDIELVKTLGRTLEYRKKHTLINESHGYMSRVVGEKGSPILIGDENEDEKNSEIVWMRLEKAIELMEQIPEQENLYNQYCNERDLAFLRKAQELR